MAKEDKKKAVEAQEMDWDDGISAEATSEEFPAIPPIGEYDFTVLDFEKTFSSSGKKMAKLSLVIDYKDFKYKFFDYLVLSTNMAWKLAAFFESLGLKKKGTELKQMPWNQIMGKTGRCKIKHEDYNGQIYMKVDKYIPTVASQAPTAPGDGSLPFEV